jgi:DNA polymerase-3 subunit delta
MLSKALLSEIKKGLPGGLYYIWSEEGCFLEEVLSKFIDIVIGSAPVDFNYDLFDSSSDSAVILDAATTLPFMSPRRLVVLKDFHQFPPPVGKNLMTSLKEPSETTCILVLSQKQPKKSVDGTWNVYSLVLAERDVPAWLRRFAAERGVRLADEAVECLIEFIGYDSGLLMMEVEKLALSGKKSVSKEDIILSTGMMREYTSFDLIDSLIAGERERAFRILKTMFAGNAYEAPVILGTLNWHYKQFYSLWEAGGRRPARMRQKTYRTLLKYLHSFREDDFYHIFRSLHKADLGIKTSGRPEIVIETLLIRLLQTGAWS